MASIAEIRAQQLRTAGEHYQPSVDGLESGLLCVGPTALEEEHNNPLVRLDQSCTRPNPRTELSPIWTQTQ